MNAFFDRFAALVRLAALGLGYPARAPRDWEIVGRRFLAECAPRAGEDGLAHDARVLASLKSGIARHGRIFVAQPFAAESGSGTPLSPLLLCMTHKLDRCFDFLLPVAAALKATPESKAHLQNALFHSIFVKNIRYEKALLPLVDLAARDADGQGVFERLFPLLSSSASSHQACGQAMFSLALLRSSELPRADAAGLVVRAFSQINRVFVEEPTPFPGPSAKGGLRRSGLFKLLPRVALQVDCVDALLSQPGIAPEIREALFPGWEARVFLGEANAAQARTRAQSFVDGAAEEPPAPRRAPRL